jgi:hypothetical protein
MRTYLALGAMLLAVGCKYNKETVPVDRDRVPIRVPHQQRIVALAVEEAVESLDLSALAGKSVSLEMTGVFPHSDGDLLGYLLDRLEGKLTRAGIRVLHPAPVLVVPASDDTAVTAVSPPNTTASTVGALTLADDPDFRLLVGVSWAGLDTRDKVRTDETLLTKQLGLAIGGFLGGLTLFTIADRTYGYVLSGLATVGGPAGAYMWSRWDTPFKHTYTLLGRARIVIDAIPTGEGAALQITGEGTAKIVADDNVTEGYMVK